MEGSHSHSQPLPQQTQSQQVIGVDSSNAVYANSQPPSNGTVYTNNQATHSSNNAVYSNNQTGNNADVFSNNNSSNHGNNMPPGGVAYNPVRRYSEPVNMITPIPIPRTNPQQWLGMSLEYLGINPGTTFIQQPLQGSPEHSRRRLPERRLPPTPEESDLSVILASNNRKLVKASGASTVAIDNKIEQAMDLVKSHLMFAVREEVEVLKEQIKELLEKNNQLEYENSILKAAATPETMTKLQQSQPPTSAS